jgi:hypothetical protein
MEYATHIDDEVQDVVIQAFIHARRADPAGMMMSAAAAAESVGHVMAFITCTADAYGGKTREAVARDITAEVARRTEPLGVYAQETAVARVQRAFSQGLDGPPDWLPVGELDPDR